MAEFEKKDAFYFPHFCNARHDRKIRRVRKELGVEGYGIFFMLLEVLREQADYCYPMDDIDLLCEELGTSEQKVRTVICNYDLFQVTESDNFFSSNFIMYLQPYLKGKETKKAGGIKGNLIRYGYYTSEDLKGKTPKQIMDIAAGIEGFSHSELVSDRLISQIKGNQIKINKNKSNKIKQNKKEVLSDRCESVQEYSHYTGEPEPTKVKGKLDNFLNYWNEKIPQEQLPSTLNLSPTTEQINFIQITELEHYQQCVDNYSDAYDFNKSKMAGFRSSLSQKFIMNWFSPQSVENCKQRAEIGKGKDKKPVKQFTEEELAKYEEDTF